MFKDRTLLITGGTGSFGSTVLAQFIKQPFDEIRIFSRDEKKQEDQRHRYNDPRLSYHIGDVRDYRSILNATRGVDFIFHAAALKQVPSCEFHPMEAVKTNVLGTDNVLEAAITNSVSRVVCLSTDKAVYPINAMGISKAMMEKVMVAKARTAQGSNTTICGTRYGNVLASRGSVVPLFIKQVLRGDPITLTDPAMTRFVMTLAESVDLVLHAFANGNNGDLFVQKAPAVTVQDLALAVLEIMGRPDHPVKVMGTRHGEKLFEALLSREEMAVAQDGGRYYRVAADNRDLNYSVFESTGEPRISEAQDFNSHNAERLDVAQMRDLLLTLEYIQQVLRGGSATPED
ncbi:MAG: polysaccharide biosynthesis protein [Brevundimonas sp.]|nr:polysaccharide biosynthesis protein [Brevundimonas sp.]